MAKITSKQRVYIRKRTKSVEPDPSEVQGELNIVPFMDILVVILTFLLMASATIAFFSQVEVRLPKYQTGGVGSRSPDESLNLNLTVTEAGIIVSGSGGKLAPGCEETRRGEVTTVKKKPDGYEWKALTACVAQVKKEFPEETQVTVTADPLIQYRHVIKAMDAVRYCPKDTDKAQQMGCEAESKLFPDVRLSAGVR